MSIDSISYQQAALDNARLMRLRDQKIALLEAKQGSYADSLGLSSNPISFPSGGFGYDSSQSLATALFMLQNQKAIIDSEKSVNKPKLITDKKTHSDTFADDSDVTSEDTPDTTATDTTASTADTEETFGEGGSNSGPTWRTGLHDSLFLPAAAGATYIVGNGAKNKMQSLRFGGAAVETTRFGDITRGASDLVAQTSAAKAKTAFETGSVYKDAAGKQITAEAWVTAQKTAQDGHFKDFFKDPSGNPVGKSSNELTKMVAKNSPEFQALTPEQQAKVQDYVSKVKKADLDISNSKLNKPNTDFEAKLDSRNKLLDDLHDAEQDLADAKAEKNPIAKKDAKARIKDAKAKFKTANDDFVKIAKEQHKGTIDGASSHASDVRNLRGELRDMPLDDAKIKLKAVLDDAKTKGDMRMQQTAEGLLKEAEKGDKAAFKTALRKSASSASEEVATLKASEKSFTKLAGAGKTLSKVGKVGGIALAVGIEGLSVWDAGKEDGEGKFKYGKKAKKQTVKSGVSLAGSVLGAAAAGAALGTIVPGAGNVAGFIVGAIGGAAGYFISSYVGQKAADSAFGKDA